MAEHWTENREYQEFLNELGERIPESWDDDVAMEAIVHDYIRHLEDEVERLGGCRHRSCLHTDGEPCDHGYLPIEVAPSPPAGS